MISFFKKTALLLRKPRKHPHPPASKEPLVMLFPRRLGPPSMKMPGSSKVQPIPVSKIPRHSTNTNGKNAGKINPPNSSKVQNRLAFIFYIGFRLVSWCLTQKHCSPQSPQSLFLDSGSYRLEPASDRSIHAFYQALCSDLQGLFRSFASWHFFG